VAEEWKNNGMITAERHQEDDAAEAARGRRQRTTWRTTWRTTTTTRTKKKSTHRTTYKRMCKREQAGAGGDPGDVAQLGKYFGRHIVWLSNLRRRLMMLTTQRGQGQVAADGRRHQ